jgi:hypothetical protein
MSSSADQITHAVDHVNTTYIVLSKETQDFILLNFPLSVLTATIVTALELNPCRWTRRTQAGH